MKKIKKQQSTALGIVRRYFPNVRKVVDAKTAMNVTVSKRDADSASAKMPDECAVAKAMQRHHTGAIISKSTSYVIDGDVATRFKTPESVTREIVSFDRNKVFEPGEYTLRAPSSHERLGPRDRPQYSKSRTTDTPHRAYHATKGVRSLKRK
jgi:hypothetical protein